MAKVKVPQADGEISITHLGTKVYAVSKGLVDVPEAELEEFLTHVDGSIAIAVSDSARKDAAAAAAADEKARADAEAAADEARKQNDLAVAEANAEAATRAANELRAKAGKQASSPK